MQKLVPIHASKGGAIKRRKNKMKHPVTEAIRFEEKPIMKTLKCSASVLAYTVDHQSNQGPAS